jgi:hypothetical protein
MVLDNGIHWVENWHYFLRYSGTDGKGRATFTFSCDDPVSEVHVIRTLHIPRSNLKHTVAGMGGARRFSVELGMSRVTASAAIGTGITLSFEPTEAELTLPTEALNAIEKARGRLTKIDINRQWLDGLLNYRHEGDKKIAEEQRITFIWGSKLESYEIILAYLKAVIEELEDQSSK